MKIVEKLLLGGQVGNCEETDVRCAKWASDGECVANKEWMLKNCQRSCGACGGNGSGI